MDIKFTRECKIHIFRSGEVRCDNCGKTRTEFESKPSDEVALFLPSPEEEAEYDEKMDRLHGGTYSANSKEEIVRLRTIRRLRKSKARNGLN